MNEQISSQTTTHQTSWKRSNFLEISEFPESYGKKRVSFRFILNYIKFDDSLMMECKMFYIFPSNNIIG